MSKIEVRVSLGDFVFDDYEIEPPDVAEIIQRRIRDNVKKAVDAACETYVGRIRDSVNERLDVVIQQALDRIDQDFTDDDLVDRLLERSAHLASR